VRANPERGGWVMRTLLSGLGAVIALLSTTAFAHGQKATE